MNNNQKIFDDAQLEELAKIEISLKDYKKTIGRLQELEKEMKELEESERYFLKEIAIRGRISLRFLKNVVIKEVAIVKDINGIYANVKIELPRDFIPLKRGESIYDTFDDIW